MTFPLIYTYLLIAFLLKALFLCLLVPSLEEWCKGFSFHFPLCSLYEIILVLCIWILRRQFKSYFFKKATHHLALIQKIFQTRFLIANQFLHSFLILSCAAHTTYYLQLPKIIIAIRSVSQKKLTKICIPLFPRK